MGLLQCGLEVEPGDRYRVDGPEVAEEEESVQGSERGDLPHSRAPGHAEAEGWLSLHLVFLGPGVHVVYEFSDQSRHILVVYRRADDHPVSRRYQLFQVGVPLVTRARVRWDLIVDEVDPRDLGAAGGGSLQRPTHQLACQPILARATHDSKYQHSCLLATDLIHNGIAAVNGSNIGV